VVDVRSICLILLPFLLAGCSSVYRIPGPLGSMGEGPTTAGMPIAARPAPARPGRSKATPGQAVAEAACGFEGARSIVVHGVKFRFDCSGLVEAAMASAGLNYEGSSRDLFATARELGVLHRRHRPDVGDVAFFDDTYDKDGDGRVNDPLTHVAIVTKVDGDGTIGMVHLGSSKIMPLTMNLRDPETHVDAAGHMLNDYLRGKSSKDTARVKHLAGELWVAFASFWKVEQVASR
jgi:hypothetical protein